MLSVARLSVAVDVTPYWEKLTGVGWYLHQLLTHLAADDSLRLHLYGPTVFLDAGDPKPAVALPQGPSLFDASIAVPPDVLFPGVLTRLLRRFEPRLVARRRHDVVFAPNFLVPEKLRRSRGALVVMVHDLGVRHVTWSLDDRTREALERGLEASLARAAAVITPSQAVADEVVAAGLAPAARVRAIHHGPGQIASAAPAPRPADDARPLRALRRHARAAQEPRPPARGVAGVAPRSPRLAFARRRRRLGLEDRVHARPHRARRARGLARALGYVDDAPLLALYRGARFLVFPSLYEGFGLPLLEAMAVGCPVVCSDLPVFREVAGDAAEYARTSDARAWIDALVRVESDAARRAELERAGLARAAAFDWDRSARETLEVWRAAAARSEVSGRAGSDVPARRSAA